MSSTGAQYQDPPSTGGRVELRRSEGSVAPGAVVYAARWTTPQGAWDGEILVSSSGRVTPTFHGEPPPAWLSTWTTQLLSTTFRAVAQGPSGTWPRRLTRWRASPDER